MCQYTRPTATPPRPATVQPPRSTDAPRRHTSTPPIGVTRHRPRGGIWPSPRNAQRQRPFPVVSWMATGLAPAGLRLFPPQWVRLLKSIKNKRWTWTWREMESQVKMTVALLPVGSFHSRNFSIVGISYRYRAPTYW